MKKKILYKISTSEKITMQIMQKPKKGDFAVFVYLLISTHSF